MTLKNMGFALGSMLVLFSTNIALADGNAFTPLNFDDTAYSVPTSAKETTSKATTKGTVETSTVNLKSTGNSDIQSAISKLDMALDDIRNEQIVYKSKFADIDAQYKLIRNERNTIRKEIRAINKRINDLNKAKEKIRANVL